MTSMLSVQPLMFPSKNHINQMDVTDMAQRPKSEADTKDRGRRRVHKGKDDSGDGPLVDGPEGADGHSSGTEGPSRKRRRSRKGLDKKFECPQEGCGKSYSRAEHL